MCINTTTQEEAMSEQIILDMKTYGFSLKQQIQSLQIAINKLSNVCLQECESCEEESDIKKMFMDSGSNYFCEPCWTELKPALEAEYKDLVVKGEIEIDN